MLHHELQVFGEYAFIDVKQSVPGYSLAKIPLVERSDHIMPNMYILFICT